MRQLATVILVIFGFSFICMPVYSAYKGGISYSIPIEYKNLSENELESKAEHYFYLSAPLNNGVISEETSSALVIYSILQNMNPQNIDYSVKLGLLYDKINKDRYAKGSFARAIGIEPFNPKPYFYYGEFYYKRNQYKQALRYYNKAFEYSENPDYELCYKLGEIYEKFGDTRKSLEYYRLAQTKSPNEKLDYKIRYVEALETANKVYYKK